MENNDLKEKILAEFYKLWFRIEKSMITHISRRKIWEVSDDEDSNKFVDETLEAFLSSAIDQSREETLKLVEESLPKKQTTHTKDAPWCSFGSCSDCHRNQALSEVREVVRKLRG